jgi:hypothetical protein
VTIVVVERLAQQQRALSDYRLQQGRAAQLTVDRCAKQNDVADKQYKKLIAVKKQTILGRTRNPKLAEQRGEVWRMHMYESAFHIAFGRYMQRRI